MGFFSSSIAFFFSPCKFFERDSLGFLCTVLLAKSLELEVLRGRFFQGAGNDQVMGDQQYCDHNLSWRGRHDHGWMMGRMNDRKRCCRAQDFSRTATSLYELHFPPFNLFIVIICLMTAGQFP